MKVPDIMPLEVKNDSPLKMFRVTEEGLKEARSLDSNQVLIIVEEAKNRIYVWFGKLIKSIDRYKYSQFARKLKAMDYGMKTAKIINVEEGQEPKDFPDIEHYYKNIAEDVKFKAELPKKLHDAYMGILNDLMEKTEFLTIVVANKEGLPIISLNRESKDSLITTDEVMIAGMTASLLNLGAKTSVILNNGEFDQFIMKSKAGQMMLFEIDENRLIICNYPLKASMGVSLLALNAAVNKLKVVK